MDQEWISQLAQSAKQQLATVRERDQVRLLDAQQIEAKAPSFWNELLAELRAYIDAFNKNFPGDELRHIKIEEGPTHHLLVKGSSFPYAQTKCFLNIPAQHMEVYISTADPQVDNRARRPYPLFIEDGCLRIKGFVTIDEVAKELIAPVAYRAGGY